jgi:hypothetical protein
MADDLTELLGTPLPTGIEALPDPARAELVDVIRAARRKQAADLEAAFHATLKHIPFPLRGVVKKALMG